MNEMISKDYATLLGEVKQRIRSAQYEALKAVNKELISLYWDIGRMIVERQQGDTWGKSVVEQLAKDLQAEFPGMSGFSSSNLWRMKLFYETYASNEKLAPMVREISWSKKEQNDRRICFEGKQQAYRCRHLPNCFNTSQRVAGPTSLAGTSGETARRRGVIIGANVMKRKNKKLEKATSVDAVYLSIANILETARNTAYRAVNVAMVQAYWHIGRIIVEEEQKGKQRADYGQALIEELARRLTKNYGKGFTESNLKYMRQFYLVFSIRHALRDELSWTHYRLLLKIEKDDARNFYMLETLNNKWSTRELERQVNTLLYERLTLCKNKEKVLELATKGQVVRAAQDLIKDPYVLEFLELKGNHAFLKKGLEQSLSDRLQEFLLELGKGFAFVARQKRITIIELERKLLVKRE